VKLSVNTSHFHLIAASLVERKLFSQPTETCVVLSLGQPRTLVLHHCSVMYDAAKDMRRRCSRSSSVGNARERTKRMVPLQSWPPYRPYPLLVFHGHAFYRTRQTGYRVETFSWYYCVYFSTNKQQVIIRVL
jgi:hypothetical protein